MLATFVTHLSVAVGLAAHSRLGDAPGDGAIALQTCFERFHRGRLHRGFARHLQRLRTALLSDAPPRPPRFSRVQRSFSLELIVLALQDTLIRIPGRDFSGAPRVPKTLVSSFAEILRRIERIRERETLDVPSVTQTTAALYREIGRATNAVWLPCKPVITAPLSSDRDLELYARDDRATERLAREVLTGEGAVLVTGYRGVGKSTYINAALGLHLPRLSAQQLPPNPWRAVPVRISVAKGGSVASLLRRCIRQLYSALSGPAHCHLLQPDEFAHLVWANERACFNVELARSDGTTRTEQLETGIDIDPGKLLPGAPSLLPRWSAKRNTERRRQWERRVALLDYDEDRAEEDIVRLIDLLARPRRANAGSVRVKLVFVFDEMDKMDREQGQLPMIAQLKNLFLTRHATFILVTSKDFYYQWLEDRAREDSVTSSLFSAIVPVPLLTSQQTEALLRSLVVGDESPSERESALLRTLARHLTYRATGLPREILRELRTLQMWLDDGVQMFLSDTSPRLAEVRVYAAIQAALEELDGQSTDHLGLDEGRQEQVRRGRYVLVEQLLLRGALSLSAPALEPIRAANFASVTPEDFMAIVEQLADRLEDVREADGGESLFSVSRVEQIRTIAVRPLFYRTTGRKVELAPAVVGSRLDGLNVAERAKQVETLLSTGADRALAMRHLAQLPDEHVGAAIHGLLYRLIVDVEVDPTRCEAVRRLPPPEFARRGTSEYPSALFDRETSELVLLELVRLLAALAVTPDHRPMARRALHQLLDRNLASADDGRASLPDNVLVPLVKAVAQLPDATAEAIIARLSPKQPVAEPIIRALLEVAQRTDEPLVRLLVARGVGVVPDELVGTLVERDLAPDELWTETAEVAS